MYTIIDYGFPTRRKLKIEIDISNIIIGMANFVI